MKKVITILLVAILLVSVVTPVHAVSNVEAETAIQPRWTYLNTVSAYLSINALGIATCEGSAIATVVQDVKVVVRLQQLTDTGWSTIKSWSATNAGASSAEGKYAVYKGYTYRTTVAAYVYDDSGNIIETGSASDTFVY